MKKGKGSGRDWEKEKRAFDFLLLSVIQPRRENGLSLLFVVADFLKFKASNFIPFGDLNIYVTQIKMYLA